MKIITIVGSRQTPPEILEQMEKIAKHACKKGVVVRSGKAGGADAAALKGCMKYWRVQNIQPVSNMLEERVRPEMYVPWRGFGEDWMETRWDSVQGSNIGAGLIAESLHPAWNKCSDGAKKLHTRNVCQILGKDIDTPSGLVLYYCKESGGKPTGGTATAVNLAKKVGCQTVNMLHEGWREVVRDFFK